MYIQEFSLGNFKSFKELTTLNLRATKSVSCFKEVDENNLFSPGKSEIKLMKSKAIYGANASGKSNIIKGLTVFKDIVKNSMVSKPLSSIDTFRFSTEYDKSPTFFQLIFWTDGIKYRYGFEVTKDEIIAEWLYQKSSKREEPLFIRELNKVTEINKSSFSEGDVLLNFLDLDKGENDLFRSNSLVLGTLSTFGLAKISSKIVKAISSINIISGLGNDEMLKQAEERLDDEVIKDYILKLLKVGDIGIEHIDYIPFSDDDDELKIDNKDVVKIKKKKPDYKFVYSLRTKYDENNKEKGLAFLHFSQESEGTKKLFEIAPCIYEAFDKGSPLIIDEFDARFHPLLTKEIIKLFNSKSAKTPQLIFTTHDTNLLDNKLFRKDQIDFVEKDSYSASHLYSLIDFKGVRNNVPFETDYIKGKFGAIPYLGNFSKLFNLIEDGKEN